MKRHLFHKSSAVRPGKVHSRDSLTRVSRKKTNAPVMVPVTEQKTFKEIHSQNHKELYFAATPEST